MKSQLPAGAPGINLLKDLAAIAESQIGRSESPRGSNKGAAIADYFKADDYRPNDADNGYAWCACFVDWCVRRFLSDRQLMFGHIKAPTTPAAFGLIKWGLDHNQFVFHPASGKQRFTPGTAPQPGDIVVFEFSHCGIVTAQASGRARNFTSVEGNTNGDGGREGYEVAARPRTWSQARAFIRLTPRASVARTGGA